MALAIVGDAGHRRIRAPHAQPLHLDRDGRSTYDIYSIDSANW